jgi:hypothetical protein
MNATADPVMGSAGGAEVHPARGGIPKVRARQALGIGCFLACVATAWNASTWDVAICLLTVAAVCLCGALCWPVDR